MQCDEFLSAILTVLDEARSSASTKRKPKAEQGSDTELSKKLPHPTSYSAEDLEQYFKGLFLIADANGDGVLQPDELKKLLQLCGFDLSAKEIHTFVKEADTNGDGVIEYSEFVPLAAKMLQATAPKKKVSNAAVSFCSSWFSVCLT